MGQRTPSLAETLFQDTASNIQKTAPLPTGQGVNAATSALTSAATGKADVGGVGPSASNIQEQVASNLAQAQIGQTQQQLQTAAQGAKMQEQSAEAQQTQALKQLDERTLNVQEEYLTRASQALQDFSQQQGKMDLEKDKARLEQVGFYARLANDQYAQNLENEGARARLDDQSQFQIQMNMAMFEEEQNLLADDLMFQQLMSVDKRAFDMQVNNMDLDLALQLAGLDINGLLASTSIGIEGRGQQLQQSLSASQSMADFNIDTAIDNARRDASAASNVQKWQAIGDLTGAAAKAAPLAAGSLGDLFSSSGSNAPDAGSAQSLTEKTGQSQMILPGDELK